MLVVDDGSPDGTGEIADRLAASTPGCRCCTAPPRKASAPPTSPASATRWTTGRRTCWRWTPTSPTTPPTSSACCRRSPTAPTSRSARATSPAGGSRTGACCGASSARAAPLTRGWVLGLRVRDLTGGFKCFRREVLEAIHFDSVRSHGYAFQVELTYRAVRAGFHVVEVPIVFRDRQRGTEQDVVADRRRGDVAGAAAAPRPSTALRGCAPPGRRHRGRVPQVDHGGRVRPSQRSTRTIYAARLMEARISQLRSAVRLPDRVRALAADRVSLALGAVGFAGAAFYLWTAATSYPLVLNGSQTTPTTCWPARFCTSTSRSVARPRGS